MNRNIAIFFRIVSIFIFAVLFEFPLEAQFSDSLKMSGDTLSSRDFEKRYRKHDYLYPYLIFHDFPELFLKNPPNIQETIAYNPVYNEYLISNKIGNISYQPSYPMSLQDYRKYDLHKSWNDNWLLKQKTEKEDRKTPLLKSLSIGNEKVEKILGSGLVNITPQGSAELIIGMNTLKINNPNISEHLRTTHNFVFQEKFQMNVGGTIGDKINLALNYNTEATFNFENKTKLEYKGKEDDIFQKIEVGNVSLPLTGTLIHGSQSLMGVKTEMKFGKLTITSVMSQQKGESRVVEIKGGSRQESFSISADAYEANKHFFLAQYFHDHYEETLQNLPAINSPVVITKIEVWVTNKSNSYENARNIVAFMDLGEKDVYNSIPAFSPKSTTLRIPFNEINGLYASVLSNYAARDIKEVNTRLSSLKNLGFYSGQDFEKIENARKLNEREFTLNAQLGFISLNTALRSDEVLAVAYEYTYAGKTYKVGELSTSGVAVPQALVLKLIKATNLMPRLPIWKLMMKNVYALGAYQINSDHFELNILYQDAKTGNALNYIPEMQTKSEVLVRALQMDKLNRQQDPHPDGVFDFLEGITVIPENGRIFFTTLEPFGRTLNNYLKRLNVDSTTRKQYIFTQLYDSTQTKAQQDAERNKFLLAGKCQSVASSEITLNATNINQGSVVVTANGVKLTENIDFTVDYNLGVVRILNQSLLESGTPIRVSLESNALYNMQTKTLFGTHLDYKINNNFILGGTLMHLSERPLTQKVNIGEEPISNTIWGLNTTYTTQSALLTSLVDKLPFLETKAPSTLTFEGEFAQLLPGHSKVIKKEGTAYIDDFEGTEISYDMKAYNAWSLASTPQGQEDLFPETYSSNRLRNGYNRAKLAWYVIDPVFLRNTSSTPAHLKKNEAQQTNPFTREVDEQEIFVNKYNANNLPNKIQLLNLAFYPKERGPYNYNPLLESNGTLTDPQKRWGGLQREIQTNDFEAANVQFIEFWVMDPFVLDSLTNNKGKLYFNLGDISEDVLTDSRKSFENGLPTSDIVSDVDTTVWGRVPGINSQSIVNAFDNNAGSRKFQDVGLDGLNDKDEQTFFKNYTDSVRLSVTNPTMLTNILDDPSNDDFHYYKGSDYDTEKTGILERYKKYNGYDGNSPTLDANTESASGSNLPNSEDINEDNTINEAESYYQYSVEISPNALKETGKNYITDMVSKNYTFTTATGEKRTVNLRWLQFRIPITQPEKSIGNIRDFKSIRFMRMFLKGFQDSVILRIAQLELVRGDWRKYELSMRQAGEDISVPEEAQGTLDIASVNIEENAQKQPVGYVLPPGIDRVIDPQNTQVTPLNEQSMVLKVTDLVNGDAKAAFKSVNLDVRQYKRLQMEVHAEKIQGTDLQDGDLTLFIRLGADYRNNFYEVEVPLKLTPYRSPNYDNNSESDRLLVWPSENRIDIYFTELQQLKQARNDRMNNPGSGITYTSLFNHAIEGKSYTYYIRGNPSLSNLKTIMIGIRYPRKANDEGTSRSAEVWVNELRLSNFDEKGGWAANARMIAKLADLGTVSIAGSTLKPGFGNIEQKLNERSREEINSYDISSNLELGKFFSEKSGVQIPLYMSFSESFTNPEYNPLDPDIPLQTALDHATSAAGRRKILQQARDYTLHRSLNLTNVRINRSDKKPHFYNLSNFTLNYAFNESYGHNITTQRNIDKRYYGSLIYTYNNKPYSFSPFSKIKFFDNKLFSLIHDFNINLGFTSLGIRTEMVRNYQEKTLRDINHYGIVNPTVSKDFLWNRNLEFIYDLTRSMRLEFSSSNMARIDEPTTFDIVNRYLHEDYQHWKDSVWHNIRRLGRNTLYNHDLNLTYTLPVNKLPLMDWVNSNLRYSASYNWEASPLDTLHLGNIIRNSNTLQLNTQMNLNLLYNKVPYFKKLLQPKNQKKEVKKTKKVYYEETDINLRPGEPRLVFHRLSATEVSMKCYDGTNREIKGKTEILNDNKLSFTAEDSVSHARLVVEGIVEIKPNPLVIIGENITRILLGIKNVSFSYSHSQSSELPGFLPGNSLMGMSKVNHSWAPGYAFILGFQDKKFAERAALNNGWITRSIYQNAPYSMTHTETMNGRILFEPYPGFRLEVTMLRTFSRNTKSYFIAATDGSFPEDTRNFTQNGSLSMTIISIQSAFEKVNSGNYKHSASFDKFMNVRYQIMSRLANIRKQGDANYHPDEDIYGQPITDGTKNGYNEFSQQVLIPAFLAAYGGYSPGKVTLTYLPSILKIRPNWKISFEGLSRITFVKKITRDVTVNHSYKSTYNMGSYLTNPDYFSNFDLETGLSNLRDLQNNFMGEFDINSISITEQFSPLINIDIGWKNSLSTRLEIRKNRSVVLSTSSYQITESRNNDIVFGSGYKFKEIRFLMQSASGEKQMKSDLNLTADVSLRDNKVIVRKMEGTAQAAQGQHIVSIKIAADYNFSQSFNLRLFYDRIVNNPFTSASYPTYNTNIGISIRFTLVQ